MKLIRTILLWSLLAMALQVVGYYYLDHFYLTAETSYQEEKVDSEEKENYNNVQVKVPLEAEKVSLSSDGKYLAYYENSIVKVVNTENSSLNYIVLEGELAYYKWLPDRDIMIIAEKYWGQQEACLRFLSYDAQKDRESKLLDSSGEALKITLSNAQPVVDNITLSPLTHIMYVKVTSPGQRSNIYSINVMNQLKKVTTSSDKIGNILITPHGTRLIYEELETEKIMVSRSDILEIDGGKRLCLVATDDDDRIYLGQLEDNRVTQIFYGSLDTPTHLWQNLYLPRPVAKEAIQVTKDGQVYLNDSSKGIIVNALSGKETVYQGQFLQTYDDGIASLFDGKLVKTLFQ